MRFEWDEAKRLSNIEKHGVDFAFIESLFSGYTVTVLDDRFDYGEYRFVTIGRLVGQIVTVAHTETDELIRIISVRKATRHEEEGYFEALGEEPDSGPADIG